MRNRVTQVNFIRIVELVLDLLQSVVEIITYGDKHDPSILECFMDRQVVAEFVRMLDISENSRIEAPLLQYLSIMIQNMDNEHAICKTAKIFRPINSVMHEILCYAEMLSNMVHRIQMASYWYLIQYAVLTLHLADYCFSNGYINSIILHPYELDGGDLAPYYMSFLRAVSGKINRDTLCLLVNVHGVGQNL
ncbi:hypothetical protein HN873_016210 [Arachis hypogaea]